MLTPRLAVIILIWVLGCAVIWLVWRAARLDARAQREAEETKAAPPPNLREVA